MPWPRNWLQFHNQDAPRVARRRFSIVIWAIFFGCLGGIFELTIFLLKCHYFDPRNYNVSRHFPWMFPVSGLLIVGTCGLLLEVFDTLRRGKTDSRTLLLGISFPAILGVLFRLPLSTVACLILAAGISLRSAGYLAARVAGLDRLARRSVIGFAGLIALTIVMSQAWSVGRKTSRPVSAKPGSRSLKNVLLIVLDTVRADRLSFAIDKGEGTTPNLARHARRGLRFERAYSTAPWTAPSHASMFTGRWPHELNVGWNQPLEAAPPTLAEALADEGFKTAGFVANTTYCSYETGLDRGFEHYEDYDVNLGSLLLCSSIVQRSLNFIHQHPSIEHKLPGWNFANATRKDASRIRADFLRWLSRQDGQRFFAFLNLFDAHHPYLSPESEVDALSKQDRRLLKTWWDIDKQELPPRDVAMARDAYDECIRYLDQQVGILLDDLDRQGILKETLVVITADHGEHLGERNLYGHGCSLYGSELQVPLIVIGEGAVPAGVVVRQPVTLRDLPTTVIDLLNLENNVGFPGRSLAASWSSDPISASSPILSSIDAPPEVDPNSGKSPIQKGPMQSVIVDGLHYIRNGDGHEELYAIEADPLEETNLAGSPLHASTLDRLRSLRQEAAGKKRSVGSAGTRLGHRAGL